MIFYKYTKLQKYYISTDKHLEIHKVVLYKNKLLTLHKTMKERCKTKFREICRKVINIK